MRTKVILLLLLGAVAASAAYILLRPGSSPGVRARITRDGAVVEEIDLDQVGEGYSSVLEDESGRNTVRVEQGRICISEADCPDQVCVNQGWISDGTVPIVCLPHKLMIQIIGGGGGLDGAAG